MAVELKDGSHEQCEIKYFDFDKSFIVRTHDPSFLIPEILNNLDFRDYFIKNDHPYFRNGYMADYTQAPTNRFDPYANIDLDDDLDDVTEWSFQRRKPAKKRPVRRVILPQSQFYRDALNDSKHQNMGTEPTIIYGEDDTNQTFDESWESLDVWSPSRQAITTRVFEPPSPDLKSDEESIHMEPDSFDVFGDASELDEPDENNEDCRIQDAFDALDLLYDSNPADDIDDVLPRRSTNAPEYTGGASPPRTRLGIDEYKSRYNSHFNGRHVTYNNPFTYSSEFERGRVTLSTSNIFQTFMQQRAERIRKQREFEAIMTNTDPFEIPKNIPKIEPRKDNLDEEDIIINFDDIIEIIEKKSICPIITFQGEVGSNLIRINNNIELIHELSVAIVSLLTPLQTEYKSVDDRADNLEDKYSKIDFR